MDSARRSPSLFDDEPEILEEVEKYKPPRPVMLQVQVTVLGRDLRVRIVLVLLVLVAHLPAGYHLRILDQGHNMGVRAGHSPTLYSRLRAVVGIHVRGTRSSRRCGLRTDLCLAEGGRRSEMFRRGEWQGILHGREPFLRVAECSWRKPKGLRRQREDSRVSMRLCHVYQTRMTSNLAH